MNPIKKQLLLSILSYAAMRGVDAAELCRNAGFLQEDLLNDAIDLTSIAERKLWTNAANACKDVHFGLHFGESLQLAALGVAGELIKTHATVGAALSGALLLVPMITGLFTMEMKESGKMAKITLVDLVPDQPSEYKKLVADFLMTFTIRELDGLLLKRLDPVGVRYPYKLNHVQEYERVFRCPVHVAKYYGIEFERSSLDRPLITADYEMQQCYLQRIAPLAVSEQGTSQMYHKVRSFLYANSYQNLLSLQDVASNFNITARTLQRKLQEEGKRFHEIAEEVRCVIAIELMDQRSYPLKEVSRILGYNELSAFSRAFKKWTGKNAGEFVK